MIVSLNEVEGLVLKACRGAGTSWGIAEDAAQAARWLATRNIDWDRSLLEVLRQQPTLSRPTLVGGALESVRSGLLCPLHVGAAVSDLAGLHPRLAIGPALEPIWLLPFAYRHARPGRQVVVSWTNGAARLAPDSDACDSLIAVRHLIPQPMTVTVVEEAAARATARLAPSAKGVTVNPEVWRALDSLAAKTYVPASLQSRLAGARAGLSDND